MCQTGSPPELRPQNWRSETSIESEGWAGKPTKSVPQDGKDNLCRSNMRQPYRYQDTVISHIWTYWSLKYAQKDAYRSSNQKVKKLPLIQQDIELCPSGSLYLRYFLLHKNPQQKSAKTIIYPKTRVC